MRNILFLLVLVHLASKATAQCSGDCQNGFGIFTAANGDKYSGHWKDGKPEGKGHYIWATGNEYMGDWSNGVANGFGHILYANGSWFMGKVVNNVPGSIGFYFNTDGSEDTTKGFGMFRVQGCSGGDCKSGYGTFVYENAVYVGNFSNGFRNGQGEYYWSTGDYYSGGFQNDAMEGQGTLVLASGKSSVGQFSNSVMTKGTNYDESGVVDFAALKKAKDDSTLASYKANPLVTDGSWNSNLSILLNDLPNHFERVLGTTESWSAGGYTDTKYKIGRAHV